MEASERVQSINTLFYLSIQSYPVYLYEGHMVRNIINQFNSINNIKADRSRKVHNCTRKMPPQSTPPAYSCIIP
jgi:hypothetical protein